MTEVLTQAEELHAKALKPGCDAWVKALQAARKANDPDPAIVEGIIALEAIEKAAKEAQALLRQKILASCDDSGVTGFVAGPYEVSRVRGKRSAEVTDETALRTAHPELFEPQPDKLNKSELTKALRKGAVIAGAVMGEPGIGHIMIKARAR